MSNTLGQILAIFAGLITVAIVATLVSKQADTANIITQTFHGFGSALQAATGPVTGSSSGLGNLNF